MTALSRWTGPLDSGPFRFASSKPPLHVIVRHHVVEPGPDGPVTVGCIESEFVDGELVRRESSGTTTAPRPARGQ
jgi:hypothetical protein